jgi:hypothetical protein
MSRLPLAQFAIIDEAKIRAYLLSTTHPSGRAKATFFEAFGFSDSRWDDLRASLLEHGQSNDVTKCEETAFGAKYIVEGPLVTPDRRRPMLRSVWFVAVDEQAPRLVTAYPLKEDRT